MRLLVDECLGVRIVKLLTAAGHDVVHVEDRGLGGHNDDEVLAFARADGRVLVSADTDFGEILSRSGAVLPSCILFR